MTPIRLLVIEDKCLCRLGIRTAIESQSDMKIVAEAATASAGLLSFREYLPDIIITNLSLPDKAGVDLINALRELAPAIRIIVLSGFEGAEYLHRATEAGVMGYLTKDSTPEELLCAIRSVSLGQPFISPSLIPLMENRVAGNELTLREQSALQLLALGWSNKQIARDLGIAEKTVRIHFSSVFSKIGAANRTHAVLLALEQGFVDPHLPMRKDVQAHHGLSVLDRGAA